ncbi:MAG TPA: restriction endonuclease [Eubacterium sp.]|nr:restriction endonuclease [Eubacterium sp.]
MNAQDLKNSILQLAVQGKLVEQRAEEGTARELLEQIKLEKDQLIKDKKIKKSKPLLEITEDEIPFEIPESWEWVRLIDLCSLISDGTHKTPAYVEYGVPFISVKDISSGVMDFSNVKYITREEHEKLISRCKPEMNDVLLCRIGTLGKAIKICTDKEFSIFVSLGLLKLIEADVADYIVQVINSGYGYRWIDDNKVGGGTHTNKINLDTLRGMPIPIPPLEEQHRIVAKIEEILPYIDQYDKAYTKLEIFNKKFPEDMKKSILQMAMQGKLVEQRPEEGTADGLYEQIVAEKAQLIKDGKIKKEKPLPEIAEDEIPYEIPSSWRWVRFSEVMDVRDGTHDSPKYIETGIPLVTSKNISGGGLYFSNVKYISREDADKINERSNVDTGDILFAMIGSIGNPVIVNKDREFCVKNVALFKNYDKSKMCIEYVYWFLYREQYIMKKVASGGVQSFISLKVFRNYLFPLPPFEEQKRIVAKIEELLPYCDQLIK